jgi:hypothetical protein
MNDKVLREVNGAQATDPTLFLRNEAERKQAEAKAEKAKEDERARKTL